MAKSVKQKQHHLRESFQKKSSKHDNDESRLYEEEKQVPITSNHISRHKKNNNQGQDSSIMSQILNEIDSKAKHKQNIMSINKIVEYEIQDMDKTHTKDKTKSKKSAVVPNSPNEQKKHNRYSGNQNLRAPSNYNHLKAPSENSQNEYSNIYDESMNDSNQQIEQESESDSYSESEEEESSVHQPQTRINSRKQRK